MKKSMPDYITALSEDEFEILEEIFLDKYGKFVYLFWLIKDYSDDIISLNYKKTDKDILEIEFTLDKLKVKKVIKEINSNIKSDSNVLVTNKNKCINIQITKDESVSS